ncbi:MAG: M48 family metallopeptidase [Actinobacteria bacterium]|nr:M48 family metallopeptidase [Actinomycetota bacterium]
MQALSPWRRMRTDPHAWFSAEEIAKAKSYVTPLRRVTTVGKLVALLVDIAVVGFHVAPNLLDALDITNWVGRLVVTVLLITVTGTIASVPFDAWRELSYDKRWEFSTQTVKGFVTDQLKGAALGVVLFSLLFTPLWAVIRATDLWWVYGWLVVAAISLVIGVLAPVVIMPIFNKFTPLDDADLRDELLALARQADADVSEVLVSDASRRSRKDNAFVTGMGKTRRLVLFDTILARPREQLRSVTAHEIGHWKLHHIRRMIPMQLAVLFVSFLALYLVLTWDTALDFAGVDSAADPAALPLFLLVFAGTGAFTNLAVSWLSRANERDADLFALRVTGDPDAFMEMIRSLSTDNLADLAPSWWRRVTQTHPPSAERLAMGKTWAAPPATTELSSASEAQGAAR